MVRESESSCFVHHGAVICFELRAFSWICNTTITMKHNARIPIFLATRSVSALLACVLAQPRKPRLSQACFSSGRAF